VGPVVAARLAAWPADARRLVLDAFAGRHDAASRAAEMRLASDAVTLETFATHLAYEAGTRRGAVRALAALRQHMLMFLPILSAIADRVAALRAQGGLTPPVRRLIEEIGAWIQAGEEDPAAARRLRAAAAAATPARPTAGTSSCSRA
jgi:hypothetical protein